jgi:hypothetical protein
MKKLRHVIYALQAIGGLMVYDVVARMGFARTHALVARFSVAKRRPTEQSTPGICSAVAEACVWYVKKVHCLQRIGCRPVPVQSHAWVEVNGQVVNDRPQYQKFFQVLERF